MVVDMVGSSAKLDGLLHGHNESIPFETTADAFRPVGTIE
jgi:hypothetical protein